MDLWSRHTMDRSMKKLDEELRRPVTPGEILAQEFLIPLGMTQREFAAHIGHDVNVVSRIVNGRAVVTAAMALKLAAAFEMSPEFWLNAQKAVDLYEARRNAGRLPRPIRLDR